MNKYKLLGTLSFLIVFVYRFFEFLGNAAKNSYLPFNTNFIIDDNQTGEFIPLDPDVVPCSFPVNVSNTFILRLGMFEVNSYIHVSRF